MKKFLKSWVFLFVVVFTVVFLTFMVLSSSEAQKVDFVRNITNVIFTPIQNGAAAVGNFFSDKLSYFTEFDELKTENGELEQRVRELEDENRELERFRDENEELREYLGIKEEHPDYEFVMAEVIARDPGNLFYAFTIDQGTLAGIELKDTVITPDGLCGYVSEVGTNWAKVTTIINSDSVVGALVSRTRDAAVLEGGVDTQKEGTCRLTMLPSEKSASIGDTAETSGLGGLFPKGLLIGTITKVEPESHGICYYAEVEPAVDFERIRSVCVITSFAAE